MMPRRTATKQPGGTWAVDIGATLTCHGLTKQSAEDWAQDVEYKIQAFGAVVVELECALAVADEAISEVEYDGPIRARLTKSLSEAKALLARVKKGEEL